MRAFNKIFGVGISRTGTTSLTAALNVLGIPTVHWPRSMTDFLSHRAAVDITVACRFMELDRIFPGSLFIYTHRTRSSWLPSVTAHYAALGGELRLPEGEKQFAQEADIRIYGSVRPGPEDFLGAYRRHHRVVTRYFQDSPDRLLRLNVVGGEGWRLLCRFLDLPVLDIPFPHANAAPLSRRAGLAGVSARGAEP